MLLLNFSICFWSIFFAPQTILAYFFQSMARSLRISYGIILSFTFSWCLFLLSYSLEIDGKYLNIIFYAVFLFSIYLFLKNRSKQFNKDIAIWIISILLLFPLYSALGENFRVWDAVVSWNRWAIEFYKNTYQPVDAAYPVLLPGIWSIFYKVQNTNEIWWTAQSSLIILPFFTISLLIALYEETRDKTFFFVGLFSYPYIVWRMSVSGSMDMPVMLSGILCLLLIYRSEISNDNVNRTSYFIAALLVAGVSSIIKQSGAVFLICSIYYFLINRNRYDNKRIIYFFILISVSYFISYLVIYFLYKDNPIANLGYLKNLSEKKNFAGAHSFINSIYLLFRQYIEKTIPEYGNILIPFLSLLTIIVTFFRLKYIKFRSIYFTSFIFWILGILIWSIYFSYDSRNRLFTLSFLIISSSIICSQFLDYIIKKISLNKKITIKNYNYKFLESYFIKYIYLSLLISFLVISYQLGDSYAYAWQKYTQSKIGVARIAITASKLVVDKDKCLRIYTNQLPTVYNYYANNIRNRMVRCGLTVGGILDKYLNHNCPDGRYFIVGPWDKKINPDQWQRLLNLEKSGVIKRVGQPNDYIFFVPPGIQTSKP